MLEQRPTRVAGDADRCTLASRRVRSQKHQGSHHEVALGLGKYLRKQRQRRDLASSAFRHAGSKGGIRRAQLLSVTVPSTVGDFADRH